MSIYVSSESKTIIRSIKAFYDLRNASGLVEQAASAHRSSSYVGDFSLETTHCTVAFVFDSICETLELAMSFCIVSKSSQWILVLMLSGFIL